MGKKKIQTHIICQNSFSPALAGQGSTNFTCTSRRGPTFPSSEALLLDLGAQVQVLQSSSCCGDAPAHAVVTHPHSPRFTASPLGAGKADFCAVSNEQNPDTRLKTFPKTVRLSLTAQRYWNFFSTTARIFLLPFFLNFIFNSG